MHSIELDPSQVRDIAPLVLDGSGRLRVLPAEFWMGTTMQERALFGHRHAIYSFPTTELVEHLREVIAGRSAIEIGAGHGVLAEALGIPATDNRMQAKAKYRRIYDQVGQPTITYGRNVSELDAAAALTRHQPEVVIACWVTHRYDPRHHSMGGNEIGVDEADVIRRCALYLFVGNEVTHKAKPVWDLPHALTYPPFLFSRAASGGRDFIAAWQGGKS